MSMYDNVLHEFQKPDVIEMGEVIILSRGGHT